MKNLFIFLLFTLSTASLHAQALFVESPDGKLKVAFELIDGKPMYNVSYNQTVMLENSPLGLITNIGDLSKGLTLVNSTTATVTDSYTLNRCKTAKVDYMANSLVVNLQNDKRQRISITFQVSDNNIAFRYSMPQQRSIACCVVESEASGFNFPDGTTTFICPQSAPMVGWNNSKPSYEEEYIADEAAGTSKRGEYGFTFPCLFREGDKGWVLVSETGVGGDFCASHLSNGTTDALYTIAFPHEGENNGFGSATAAIPLPGTTPWRTLTVADNLKPIVETTIPFDVVKPLYEPSQDYQFGRSTWSWIIWQDASCNYKDQQIFMDLAADMGYEYILIDALWDKQIGYDKMPSLIKYGQDKGVNSFVWYNSNGPENSAPQGPKNRMFSPIARKAEMKWLKELGVKGIKVDFFGGDKQETMRLYEAILSDANDYGLMVIFHGCTLPRGWERMYPNYVGSEAVLASENLVFQQHFCDEEAFNACLHPFIRNTVGSMEFGGVFLNKRLSRDNKGGTTRRTGDAFELCTGILFQNPIQNIAITPNNLTDAPAQAVDFLKTIPTTWEETRFIDGFPGKYVILARRHGDKWYLAAINATKEPLKIKVALPMFSGKTATHYSDNKNLEFGAKPLKLNKKNEITLEIPSNGGNLIVEN